MTLAPVTAPALLATFASASACIDRLARTIPVEAVEIVDDPPTGRTRRSDHALNLNRERDATIVREWMAGKTAALVADELGLGRGAVMWTLRRDIPAALRVRIGAEHRAESARRRIVVFNARRDGNNVRP